MLPPARRVSAVLAVVMVTAVGATMWRPIAQERSSGRANAVELLDQGARLPPRDPADRGATYYWLEGQAKRVTTRFADAVAIAERAADGGVRARLADVAGNELATLVMERKGSAVGVIDFRRPGRAALRVAAKPEVRPTLDWANRQAYTLWKDLRRSDVAPLEWRDGIMRAAGALVRPPDSGIHELRTDWPDDVSATVVAEARVRRHPLTGSRGFGTFFISTIRKGGQNIGSVRWEAEEKLLTWDLPSITQGYVDSGRLAEVGGWTFTPDAAWGNVQSYAFYHFGTLIAEKGFVARQQAPTWLHRVSSFFVPSVEANTEGCDGLHWLDDSVFRMCCDVHDACYSRSSCSYRSWWMFWTSWQCTYCNMWAVSCFVSRGIPPYQQTP